MDAQSIKKVYIDAVDAIIANLRQSDFVTEFGCKAVYGLMEYRLDMALDIQKVVEKE